MHFVTLFDFNFNKYLKKKKWNGWVSLSFQPVGMKQNTPSGVLLSF